ncbi:integrase core domain-containing protein, partial [Shigella flexneri]|uniref:integrase core domain-containing protein n=1 Tax=Shigella flexneri TaxID=623 RepID=UPI0020966D0F
TGSTGDSYDNAMAESINGLYKAEVIHRKSWKNRAEVELATLTWVDWYNNRRLLGRLGHTPPAEAEKAYYASIGNDDLLFHGDADNLVMQDELLAWEKFTT